MSRVACVGATVLTGRHLAAPSASPDVSVAAVADPAVDHRQVVLTSAATAGG